MSDLGEEIVKQYIARVQGDKKLREIARTIRNGGGYADAEQYAVRAGEVLSEVFRENITADNFPVGSVNDIYQLIAPSIKMNYEANSQAVALVQKHLNTEGGIGMKPIPTQYDDNATMNIVGRMAKYESYEDAEFMLDQPIVTNSLGTVDKALRENADFQYKSGLKPKIVRTCEADACEWCQELEGEYDYDEVKDRNNPVFQRHNNCQCEITYEPGDGRVQDVNSRQWYNSEEERQRINSAKREAWRQQAADALRKEDRIAEANNPINSNYHEIVGEQQRGYSYQLYPYSPPVNTPEWYIESEEWQSRFNVLDVPERTIDEIITTATNAVLDNKGTNYESMYLVDVNGSDVIASIDKDEDKHNWYVSYTQKFIDALQYAHENNIELVAVHNHPNGLPPSADDFRKAYENGYSFGIVAGNNGQVYQYSNNDVPLTPELCDEIHKQISILLEYKIDPDEAFQMVYSKYGLKYNILEETIQHD